MEWFPASLHLCKDRLLQFLGSLSQDVNDVFLEACKCENVTRIIQCNHPAELTHSGECLWNLTIVYLTLIKDLYEKPSVQELQSTPSQHNVSKHSKVALRINQKISIKRCFQYAVTLGILPNVISSIRGLLRRPESSNAMEKIDISSTVQQKYYMLLITLKNLCDCLGHQELAEVILQNHSNEILAALLQLCYAPIKKIDMSQRDNIKDEFPQANEQEKYEDLDWYLSKLRDCNDCTDEDFIVEMGEDRKYFHGHLTKFLKQISPSDLMWQLLCLQGTMAGSTIGKSGNKVRAPSWLTRICNQMLTEKFFDKNSIRLFIQMVAETMACTSGEPNRLGQEKINAIARIISHNPAKHMPLETYMKEISIQLKSLLQDENPGPERIFPLVASSVILNFAQRNFELSESIVSQNVFTPFWLCLQSKDTIFMDGDVIASEESLTTCIENAYEVFISNHPVLSDEAVAFLLRFYHLLFVMFVKLVNGVSFLKSKVKDLLVTILNRVTSIEALKLLTAATFEDVAVSHVAFATNLNCIYGDNGGIAIIKNSQQCETLEEVVTNRCQAVTLLLDGVSEKKVKTSFFLEIVKRTVHLERNDPDYVEMEDVKVFINVLIAAQLTEELADSVSEDLINNIEEAVGVVKVALESINVQKGEDAFSDETVLSFLVILSTLVSYKKQLKSLHWNALKECLPPLEVLSETTHNSLVKEMICGICNSIRLKGAVSSSKMPPFNEMNKGKGISEGQKDSRKLIEDITNIAVNRADVSADPDKKSMSHDLGDKLSIYHQAMLEANDMEIPVRSHGLVSLTRLVQSRDEETLFHKQDVFQLFQKSLLDEDSYVYLPAILGLSSLGDLDVEMVLPVLLSEFRNFQPEKWELTLKCGEALMKICRGLSELTPKYRDQFLSTFLIGVRHQDPLIRASSLSNVGEVCKMLRFSIGSLLQEIILCVTSVLKTDPSIEVRRAAVLVVVMLLRGTGKDTFSILGNELKDLYKLLKKIYMYERDDVLKLHAQEGLVHLNNIVLETFETKAPMVKEIKII